MENRIYAVTVFTWSLLHNYGKIPVTLNSFVKSLDMQSLIQPLSMWIIFLGKIGKNECDLWEKIGKSKPQDNISNKILDLLHMLQELKFEFNKEKTL